MGWKRGAYISIFVFLAIVIPASAATSQRSCRNWCCARGDLLLPMVKEQQVPLSAEANPGNRNSFAALRGMTIACLDRAALMKRWLIPNGKAAAPGIATTA